VSKINPPPGFPKMPRQALRYKDRTVLAPGTAYRNREIFFPLCRVSVAAKAQENPVTSAKRLKNPDRLQ